MRPSPPRRVRARGARKWGEIRRDTVAAAVALAISIAVAIPAQAGHEASFYPSYYPHEIRIESVAPAAAGRLLQQASIHAFIGSDPFAERPVPDNVASVRSLGVYVVVTLNTASRRLGDPHARCALAHRLTAVLGRDQGRYVFHPYPVTPYHMDYLVHYDLAQAAKEDILGRSAADDETGRIDVTVDASGALAQALVGTKWPSRAGGWDARVETVDPVELLSANATNVDGVLGPPWLKEGWFSAYLLLGRSVTERGVRADVDRVYHRLVTGDYRGIGEKANLGRALVSLLRQGCERVVVGYTERAAYFNVDYSQGIENVGYDSQTGVNSAIFIRTVKLKDFIWNGWLRLGVAGAPVAAWNPIGGFGDAFGRLLSSAVEDPPLLPGPYSAGWVSNRVNFRLMQDDSWLGKLRHTLGSLAGWREAVQIPADAVMPDAHDGVFRNVGPGKWAGAKVEYQVLASSFHDGTPMTAADALYPYLFSRRWGGEDSHDAMTSDSYVARSTASMRQHLVGVKVLRTEKVVRVLGTDIRLYDLLVVDVYLDAAPEDPETVAAIAPPWSTIPWHLMVLMEEAVRRGVGAFSAEEAAHRDVAWLDLVRAQGVKENLARLVDELEARNYIPDALRGLVTGDNARERWQALRKFYRTYGHFLVTNGPYRLKTWSDNAVVLEAFRDPSYPLGVGSFDRYAWPRRAFVAGVSRTGDRLEIQADVERIIKFGRSFRIVTERLGSNSSGAIDVVTPVCRYVAVGAGGQVVKIATAEYRNNGTYTIDVHKALGPGIHTLMVAVYLNENYTNPDVKMVR